METRKNLFGSTRAAYQAGHDAALGDAAFVADKEYVPQFEKLETSSALSSFAIPIILGYLAVATIFFAHVEDWEYSDAVYFCAVTLTTVGYGDLAPTTDASKIFAICYILGGLSIVATSLGVLIGSLQGTLESATMRTVRLSTAQIWMVQALRSVVVVVLTVGVGATFVYFNEGWGVLDSIYWAVVTASSVGYGDLTIEQESTRQFNTVYVLLGVGAFAVSLSKFGTIIMEIEAERHVDAFIERGVSVGMLNDIKLNANQDDAIDKYEFLKYMLVAMGKVTQEDVDKVLQMFDAMDEDGSGQLDEADIREAQRKRSEAKGGAPSAARVVPRAPAAVAPIAPSAEASMSRGNGGNWLNALAKPLLEPLLGNK